MYAKAARANIHMCMHIMDIIAYEEVHIIAYKTAYICRIELHISACKRGVLPSLINHHESHQSC